MHAIVYEGVGNIKLKEVDNPKITDDNVIIKVNSCAICGTDVKAYTIGISSIKPPVILGHEISGTIEEVGKNIRTFKKNDRVTLATTLPCGECIMCNKALYNLCLRKLPVGTFIDGGFAEYLEIPARAIDQGYLMKIPDSLSNDNASLCEPIACVINSQNLINSNFRGIVVIIGGGPMGFIQAEVAKARGAAKTILIESSKNRCKAAINFNIDHIICSDIEDPLKKLLDITNGYGADVVINAAPAKEAVELAFSLVAKSGHISLFASIPKDDPFLNVDINNIHYNQISVYGASDSKKDNHAEAIKLLDSGKINVNSLITHKFILSDFFKGIDLIRKREALKVIINP